jgi:hypothetical protein
MDEDEAKRIAEKLYQSYKNETDEEIERVRTWVRSLIDGGREVSYCRPLMDVLDRIVHERVRAK